MAYELIKTLTGPIIKYNNEYITPQEIHLLIELAESDESFIPAFKAHLIETLRTSANEICEALEDGISHTMSSFNPYLNASFIFNNFINGPWANYQKAKLEGGFK